MNVAKAVATEDECLQCLSPDAKRIGELEQQDGKARTCVRIGSGCRHVKKGEILTVGHTHLPAKNLNGSAPHIGLKRGTAAA